MESSSLVTQASSRTCIVVRPCQCLTCVNERIDDFAGFDWDAGERNLWPLMSRIQSDVTMVVSTNPMPQVILGSTRQHFQRAVNRIGTARLEVSRVIRSSHDNSETRSDYGLVGCRSLKDRTLYVWSNPRPWLNSS
eukprot:TRINITY_DN8999_c0_g2_i1.p3 TRINITY_DN8999_c0_g2~~TRINITY_DN8999_c0_g2_i1.p3  ORF type:complete len:136 (-),score=3.20 TRINITY_DN8999_c0_g2_i1:2127-2534(-)